MKEQKQNLIYYLRLLYPYVKKDRGLLIFGLFIMLITSALQLVDPLILAMIVDKSVPAGDMGLTLRYGLLFIGVVLVSGFLSYLQIVLLSRLGIKVITNFKSRVFEHLLKLPVDWFNKQSVGELIARVESDSERVKVLFSDLSIRIIGNLLFFVGVFLVLSLREWQVTVWILPAMVVMIFAYFFLIRYLAKFYRKIREKYADISAHITDYVQGMPMIQALNQEKRVVDDLRRSSHDKYALEARASFVEYGSQSLFSFFLNVAFIVVVISLTAPKIIIGAATLGTLIVFVEYISRMMWPLMQLSENVMQIQRS
ncbi:MAG: ABC transporter ATP-binding protein, partial [Candidatus Cloacimonetes bacterium]|nr:ABC transporter ATP-binding protein [Candidatus Cloacimonadota bacterium]